MTRSASFAAAAVLAACLLAPALAGAASPKLPEGLEITGFNGRGLFFGIEQFGLRPGAKTPYAEIRIYDLRSGQEIERSPFVFEVREKIPQGVTLKQAVERARRGVYLRARNVIRYLTLVPRGRLFIPKGEKGVKSLFLAAPGLSGGLTLRTFPLPSARCGGIGTKGYALTISTAEGETEIHRDRSLPAARGCPVDYDITAAAVYLPFPDANALAVIIAARQGGKEAGATRYTVSGRFFDHRKKK